MSLALLPSQLLISFKQVVYFLLFSFLIYRSSLSCSEDIEAEQPAEWASTLYWWLLWKRNHISPEWVLEDLNVVEPFWSSSQVVVESHVSEEKTHVSPEGSGGNRLSVQLSNELLLSAHANWLVKSVDIEEMEVVLDELHLLVELSLEGIWPGSGDGWLESQHEWPDWAGLLVTMLINLSPLHDGGVSEMSGSLSEFRGNGHSSASVLWLSEVSSPRVSKEVERWLSSEGEHSKTIGGSVSVSKEFDSESWGSSNNIWDSSVDFRNSHDTVLSSLEDSSVWMVSNRLVVNSSDSSSGMNNLESSLWHIITDPVEGIVGVLEEHWELSNSIEPVLDTVILKNSLPDLLGFAVGALGLVFVSPELHISWPVASEFSSVS